MKSKRQVGHQQVEGTYRCTCGAEFKTRAKIARHLQKWNFTRLRDRKLGVNGRIE